MKKLISVFLTLVMVLSLGVLQVAFAAEIDIPRDSTTALDNDAEIRPMGSLSGYGSTWYSAGNSATGSFTVPVKGVAWATAQATLKIESFDSATCVRVSLYSPSGVCLYDTLSWSGGYLTMSEPEVKKTFTPGATGNYTVKYEICKMDGTAPSSGRIMCWIY